MKLLATRKRRRIALVFVTLFGVLLLLGAEFIATWQSPQVLHYNQGIALLEAGDADGADGAMKAFDKSLESYSRQQDSNAFERALLPEPSLEYAALAHKQRAVLFILSQKPDQAVLAFKESLKLNPGDSYPAGIPNAQAERMREQALVVKYDLELLFKKNPDQAKGEGKGKGEGKPEGQPKPAPGNDPGKMPGKGNKDDL